MTFTMNDNDYSGERLKDSHFQIREDEMNIRNAWSSWNGYKLAEYYYEVEYEYFCVRNTCGTYDICPMQKYHISGGDAEAMLNRMVTRDVTRMRKNRVSYVVWCNDEGRLIDDGTIFKLADNEYMLTCGSPCTAWLKKSVFGFDDISIVDKSDDIAALALQGPTSCAVLKKLGLAGIENAKPFTIHRFDFHGETLLVSRTGFSGDLGYELWIDPALAIELWDALYDVGDDHGIHPFGEQATNMLRLEAGFIMPGCEFNEALKTVHFEHDQTPFELNLGWMVDFKKPHFNGRRALLAEKKRGPKYTLTRLDIEGNKPAEGSYIYSNRRCTREIGYVTSAMWSPVVKANIALAMIRTEHLQGEIWTEIYYEKELRQYSKVARCTMKKDPFWSPARAKATPAADF
jgi:aminomethyltransferase